MSKETLKKYNENQLKSNKNLSFEVMLPKVNIKIIQKKLIIFLY